MVGTYIDQAQASATINGNPYTNVEAAQFIWKQFPTNLGYSAYRFQMKAPPDSGILDIQFLYGNKLIPSPETTVEVIPTPMDVSKTFITCNNKAFNVGTIIKCAVSVRDRNNNPAVLTNITTSQIKREISRSRNIQNVQITKHTGQSGVYYAHFITYKKWSSNGDLLLEKRNYYRFTR